VSIYGIVGGVPKTPEALGDIARKRRLALGLRQTDVVQRAAETLPNAISEPTLRAIENGRTVASERALAAASVGLGWPADALSRIRDGASPEDMSESEAVTGVIVAIEADPGLSEDSRRFLIGMYERERGRSRP